MLLFYCCCSFSLEEEDDNEDYIRDGFVVDEEEVEKERKLQKKLAARGDLVDSDGTYSRLLLVSIVFYLGFKFIDIL